MSKKKNKKKSVTFPKHIYVTVDTQDREPILLCDETADAAEHGDQVAIYELLDVKTKRVDHSLE